MKIVIAQKKKHDLIMEALLIKKNTLIYVNIEPSLSLHYMSAVLAIAKSPDSP